MKEIYIQLVVVMLLKVCEALSPDMMIGNSLILTSAIFLINSISGPLLFLVPLLKAIAFSFKFLKYFHPFHHSFASWFRLNTWKTNLNSVEIEIFKRERFWAVVQKNQRWTKNSANWLESWLELFANNEFHNFEY